MTRTTDQAVQERTGREPITDLGWRRIALTLVVLAFFGLFVVFGFWRDLVFVFTGWFEVGAELYAEDYEAVHPHRVHIFVFGLMLWTAAAGLLAQLRAPRRNVAGQWMALIPWVGLLVALLLSELTEPLPIVGIFGGLTLVATILHPAGRNLVGSFDAARASRVLLALAIVAAVPLVAFAATQIGLQTGAIEPAHAHDHGGADHEAIHEEHVKAGHFAGTAAFTFILVGVAVLASLRQRGWWLPAWIAGLAAVVFGVSSLAYPEAASAADPLWSAAAVLWGVAFVAAAELTQDEATPTLLGGWRANRAQGETGE